MLANYTPAAISAVACPMSVVLSLRNSLLLIGTGVPWMMLRRQAGSGVR